MTKSDVAVLMAGTLRMVLSHPPRERPPLGTVILHKSPEKHLEKPQTEVL